MRLRAVALGAVAVAMALSTVPLSGQGQSQATRSIAAELATPVKGFVQPKTEWGDPDISGVWTSDAALGIPRERPDRFGNRAMLNDAEYAEAQKADADRVSNSVNASGAFRNDGGWKNKSYRQTSLVIEPEIGRTPAFTAEALKRAAPRDRGSFGEGPFNIIQAPGQVIISYEMVHDTRGHWEGNTLVIETSNFTDQTSIGGGNGNGLRHSTGLKITERITRVDKDELRYEVRVDDPKTYTAPFTISLPLTSPPGYELLPYECHEGNYGLPSALSAERQEDAAIEADRLKGIIRKRKNIQQNLDAGARPIPGRANPNDVEQ